MASFWIDTRSRESDSRLRNSVSILVPSSLFLMRRGRNNSAFTADRGGPQPCDFVRGNPQNLGGIKEGIDSNSTYKSFKISKNGCLGGSQENKALMPSQKLE